MSKQLTKNDLEALNAGLEQENAELKQEIKDLEDQINSHGTMAATAPEESQPYLEPLLLGACIGALRNPITGVAYDEAEFNAYAPKFIDQALRLHNMALERLSAIQNQ